jgi:hypothetical protein
VAAFDDAHSTGRSGLRSIRVLPDSSQPTLSAGVGCGARGNGKTAASPDGAIAIWPRVALVALASLAVTVFIAVFAVFAVYTLVTAQEMQYVSARENWNRVGLDWM